MTTQVDGVTVALCEGCTDDFLLDEGWLGYCPSCTATGDEHVAGLHQAMFVAACRFCVVTDLDEVRVRAG